MTIPNRPAPAILPIQSASDNGDFYETTLQDGTVLWVPKNESNSDCITVQSWADASNINL